MEPKNYFISLKPWLEPRNHSTSLKSRSYSIFVGFVSRPKELLFFSSSFFGNGWGSKFHKKSHSMKSKEGPIHAARRINIKALCVFKFSAKMAIKKSSKIQWKNWAEIPKGCQRLRIFGTCSTVGLRQLKRSATKYKKWRTNMSLSSIHWCSKESESLESDNSWTKGRYPEEPRMKNYKGKWLGKPSTQQEWIFLT